MATKLNDSARKEIFDVLLPHVAALLAAAIREEECGDGATDEEAEGGVLLQSKHQKGRPA